MVHDIAQSQGDTLLFDSSAPGGYTFNNHSNDLNTKAKISAGTWDYVVLQAQSQEPSFSPAQVASQTLPYAIILDSLIKQSNPCATTVFFETWGRKYGDAGNCPNYPPICTYTGMQNRLRESYRMFADTTKALMAPVGEAFRLSIANSPTLDLYQADNSHPSLAGSYLAATVFYEVLFQKSVLTSTFTGGLTGTTASFLKQVAHQIASDSIYLTNIPLRIPKASFTYTNVGNGTVMFQSLHPTFLHAWSFGDGQTSAQPNPTHSYTGPGNYSVNLVAYNAPSCKKDSMSALVQILPSVGLPEYSTSSLRVFPNPSSDQLTIRTNLAMGQEFRLDLLTTGGQVIKSVQNSLVISVVDLPKGVYYLKLSGSFGVSHGCFVKNE